MRKVWTLSLVLLLFLATSYSSADEQSVSYSTLGAQSGFSLVAPVTISETTSVTIHYDCKWQVNYVYELEGEVFTWKVYINNPTTNFTAVNGSTFDKVITGSVVPSKNLSKDLAYFGLQLTGGFQGQTLSGSCADPISIGSLTLSADYANNYGNAEAIRDIRASGGVNKNSTEFSIATVTFTIANP